MTNPDEFEVWFEKGVTDGLPVVPPTRERVERMLAGTGDAPHGISDHSSRTARELGGSVGWSMAGLWNSKHFPLYSPTMLVVGPEHARTFAADGWSREDLARRLYEGIRVPYRTLLPDAAHGEARDHSAIRGPELRGEFRPCRPSTSRRSRRTSSAPR